ncbi:MAG: AbrB/MazE/SpoVT family DNA-binding domain-containing protein [Opitutales bacterium]|nr:AbrB/MazE/SpoVT family DNA-binding domain-containing protein [Opitutales bacterium]
MKTKVSRWGNSLALRIPKKLAMSHNIFQDSNVEIIEQEDGLLLRPSSPGSYDLKELLNGVTKENLHEQVSTGSSRGQESW